MIASRESPVVLDVSPNWRSVLFALVLTLTTGVLCSVLPALRATRLAPGSLLKRIGAGRRARSSATGRSARLLVVSQVAITMVLLVGAALFVRSLTSVLSQDAGFDRDKVLVVATDAEAAGYEGERLRVTTRSSASGSRAYPASNRPASR